MKTQLFAFAALLGISPMALAQQDSGSQGRKGGQGGQMPFSIEQATSDNAQLHTIAFSGLAFITGDYGASTFIPPGKVCDYFGFQYMRDIDSQRKGHNPIFLDRVAGNVMKTLSASQKRLFQYLATEQAPQLEKLAKMRLPIIKAFWRELQGDRPASSSGLNQEATAKAVGDLFALDGELSFRRAEVMAQVSNSLGAEQKAYFAAMKFGDFSTWPDVDHRELMRADVPRGKSKLWTVAYMTYISEWYSWQYGSVEADTYFCPERHGTYFGGFYMKDMPAMGQRDFNISMTLTGDSGREFLQVLTPDQRSRVTQIISAQKSELAGTVSLRRQISTELRRFLAGQKPDKEKTLGLCRSYGELDGSMSWRYATAFAAVRKSLTEDQMGKLVALRNLTGYVSAPAYLYSDAMQSLPELPSTDRFFFAPPSQSRTQAQSGGVQ